MDDFERLLEAAKRGVLEEVEALVKDDTELVHGRDGSGATALHYAAFGGHCKVVEFLVQHGAEINAIDGEFGATPTGWAIEYLREMGGFLGIELADLAFAIERGDVDWVKRFLTRFPGLRNARGQARGGVQAACRGRRKSRDCWAFWGGGCGRSFSARFS